MIDVSVIVTVYNNESKINACLESLVNQTLDNFEIIIIDDGSQDKSGIICKDYATKYSNISYYRQENKGVSISRNEGIKFSRGKYILFCDSDDTYEIEGIGKLYHCITKKNSDISIGGCSKIINGSESIIFCNDHAGETCHKEKYIVEMTENFMINQMWGKIYKKDIILANDIFLNEDLTLGEDFEWLCRFLKYAKQISSINDRVYNYIIDSEDSLSQKFSLDYFERIAKTYKSLEQLYISMGIYEKYKDILIDRQINNYWAGMNCINKTNCNLTFKDKINYIDTCIKSIEYQILLKYKKNNSNLKLKIMNLKSPLILVFIIYMRR